MAKADWRVLWRWVLAGVVTGGVAACGGGNDGGTASGLSAEVAARAGEVKALPTPEQTAEILREAAQFNNDELAAAEADVASGKTGAVRASAKSFVGRVTAYRFYNTQTGAHFYTVNTAERDTIIATLPRFQYEGPAFFVSSIAAPGLSQVHRFYNRQTGVHFYTISASERTYIQQTLPHFQYEGVAYYASQVTGSGLTPLYRFFVSTRGFHFYSNSLAEANGILANPALPHYRYEGVGYHVLSTSYAGRRAVVPHTGVPNTRCYEVGSDTLVGCQSEAGLSLNQQQDGHRVNVNPMNYSEVPAPAGGTYPRTDCVRDNTTGLVWEGKNLNEPRSGARGYTHASLAAYVAYVNNLALCGYTNWRLPTRHELLGLARYGQVDGIDLEWFPNTELDWDSNYWSSNRSARYSSEQWTVNFDRRITYSRGRGFSYPVRLVRNAP